VNIFEHLGSYIYLAVYLVYNFFLNFFWASMLLIVTCVLSFSSRCYLFHHLLPDFCDVD
jgi:hypothetical protein